MGDRVKLTEAQRKILVQASVHADGATSREVSDERAIELALQICSGKLSAVQGAVEIMQYATDGVMQMESVRLAAKPPRRTGSAAPPVRGEREAYNFAIADQWADYSEACNKVRREMRALILERNDPKLSSLYYRAVTLSEHEAARRTLLSPVSGRDAVIEECRSVFEGVKNVLNFAIGLAWDAERLIPDSEPKRLRNILNNIRRGYLKPAVERLNTLSLSNPDHSSINNSPGEGAEGKL